MRYLRLARLTATAASPLVLVGVGASSAFGAGATSGTVSVWSVQKIEGAKAPIIFTGAIGDYGTAISQDKNGKVDANGSYVKMALKKGTFFANAVSLNNVLNGANPTYNQTNCSGSFTGAGPVTLYGGTGAYAGITGTIQVSVTFAFVDPKKANGKCNTSENANPLVSYSTITGSGTVSY